MPGFMPGIHVFFRVAGNAAVDTGTGADNRRSRSLYQPRPARPGFWRSDWNWKMTGSTRSSGGLDDRRKRLLFRCWHRGTREMDLILGRFADAEIAEPHRRRTGSTRASDRGARSRSLCRADRQRAAGAGICRARCSTASSRFAPRITTHEGAGPIARAIAGARPRADLCQCRRGRRRPGDLGSRARGRGAAEAAGGQPRGGVPRRPAHAATGAGAGILRTRFAGAAVSGLGLPAL